MAKVYVTISVEVPEADYDKACELLDESEITATTLDGEDMEVSVLDYRQFI